MDQGVIEPEGGAVDTRDVGRRGAFVGGGNTQADEGTGQPYQGLLRMKLSVPGDQGDLLRTGHINAITSVVPVEAVDGRWNIVLYGEPFQLRIDIYAGDGIAHFEMQVGGPGSARVTAVGDEIAFFYGVCTLGQIHFLLPGLYGVLVVNGHGCQGVVETLKMAINGDDAIGMGNKECIA